MIKLEKTEICGWEPAIRGMRNPMNSWEKSDSKHCIEVTYPDCEGCPLKREKYGCLGVGDNPLVIGENDFDLMKRLRNAGTDHRKFMRMITVYVDITAPLYWWKEFKTYNKGRKFLDEEQDAVDDHFCDSTDIEPHIVMNSCSTMHKIHTKEFTLDDFSFEHLMEERSAAAELLDADGEETGIVVTPKSWMNITIGLLNNYRLKYLQTNDKKWWWQMIQILPSSYNQKRTVMLNYEVLTNMYHARKNHKLDEWHDFCHWIEELPYSELITGGKENEIHE